MIDFSIYDLKKLNKFRLTNKNFRRSIISNKYYDKKSDLEDFLNSFFTSGVYEPVVENFLRIFSYLDANGELKIFELQEKH